MTIRQPGPTPNDRPTPNDQPGPTPNDRPSPTPNDRQTTHDRPTPNDQPGPTPNDRPAPTPNDPVRTDPLAPAPPTPTDPPATPAAATRAAHAAIERLVEALVPALAARLGVGDLDELEVREAGWRVRLRRPPVPPTTDPRRAGAADRADRPEAQPAAASRTGGRPGGPATASRAPAPSLVGIGPATSADPERGLQRGRIRRTVTAPAVGLFRPGPTFAVGRRVRAGDRLATIDVLGVPHDVLAPADGIVVEVGVEAGQPVEYGQELGAVELGAAESPPPRAAAPDEPGEAR
jgi:biotin carboxyl carrier protein